MLGPFLMRRFLISLAVLLTLAALAVGAAAFYAYRWIDEPLPIRNDTGRRAEITIEQRTTPREAARLWVDAGVQAPTRWLYEWFRWSGSAKRIRAGSYEAEGNISPRRLLDMMVQGDVSMEQVRIIEGWTLRQLRAELAKAPNLRPETAKMDEAQLMAAVGAPKGVAGEGRFFPDTYSYGRGVSDLTVLRRAYQVMQKRLNAAWGERAPDSPLKSPDEALILASIVEKETGQAADRPQIAGVFANRLRIGMLLQTDPTVIYGMGEAFDGNLRRKDLQTDTPWNTYTRRGLPPTPIALPGLASLRAAVRPQATKALYFVAKGDGSSAFSESLNEHNNAVNKYQRGGN
jgi:UPF0755 protein